MKTWDIKVFYHTGISEGKTVVPDWMNWFKCFVLFLTLGYYLWLLILFLLLRCFLYCTKLCSRQCKTFRERHKRNRKHELTFIRDLKTWWLSRIHRKLIPCNHIVLLTFLSAPITATLFYSSILRSGYAVVFFTHLRLPLLLEHMVLRTDTCSLQYPQHLEQHLAHSRHSVNFS